MVAIEMVKEAISKAGKPEGCAGGNCGACGAICPLNRAQTVIRGESGSGFKGSFKELLSLSKLPKVIDPNLIDFDSVRQGSGGSPVEIRIEKSEKTCPEPECNEPASTCPHSKR